MRLGVISSMGTKHSALGAANTGMWAETGLCYISFDLTIRLTRIHEQTLTANERP